MTRGITLVGLTLIVALTASACSNGGSEQATTTSTAENTSTEAAPPSATTTTSSETTTSSTAGNSTDSSATTTVPEEELVTYSGEVLSLSESEVLDGQPHPNAWVASPSNIYYVLQLDAPTELTGEASTYSLASGLQTEVGDQIYLGEITDYNDDSTKWDPFVSKQVTVTFNLDDLYWGAEKILPQFILRARDTVEIEEN